MGICYQIILYDEFDWDYMDTNKETRLKEFAEEYIANGAYCCDLIAQWPHYAVFDVDKRGPYDKRAEVVKKYSDAAWYNMDNQLYNLIKIERTI